MLSYPALLDLSPRSLRFVRELIICDRRQRGGSWYRIPAGRQGLLVLVWFRKNHTFAELAGGFNVGLTTAWRYVQQVLSLLAPLAASLPHALAAADRDRFIVLDGTCIGIHRLPIGGTGVASTAATRSISRRRSVPRAIRCGPRPACLG